jgi:hypothetical protein
MSGRAPLLLLLACAPAALGACIQEIDTNAASDPGQQGSSSPSGSAYGNPSAGASTWQLCGSPSCDNADGTIPFLQQTPPIYLPDGTTTNDPCVDIEGLSMTIRQAYCGNCHGTGSGAGQGGFNSVLDDKSLVSNTTKSTTSPHFVVPGDPYASYVYIRIADGTMPPASTAGGPQNPMPTAADLSVLYGWIQACVPGPNTGYVNGGGFYGPGGDGGSTAGAPSPEAGTEAGTDAGGG